MSLNSEKSDKKRFFLLFILLISKIFCTFARFFRCVHGYIRARDLSGWNNYTGMKEKYSRKQIIFNNKHLLCKTKD